MKLKKFESIYGKPWFEPNPYVQIIKCKRPSFDIPKFPIKRKRKK